MFKVFYKKKYCIRIMRIASAVVLTLMLISGVAFITYSEDVSNGLSDNLVRLHVIANSDSPEDQELKRDVRDRVIVYMKEKLTDVQDIDETKRIINENLDSIRRIAKDEIGMQDKDYNVEVMIGNYPFPTKMYGDVTLPAGNYQALRVVIGKGEGQNWWCVMFPPLCFVDATHGTVPDSVKEDLKKVLTDEEYCLITSSDEEDDIPVEIKFKIVEFFQESKLKFSGVVSGLFNTIFKENVKDVQEL
ncbi:MAG: stage II sporulation protein R [Clostridiaceae bacterium]|nr:stage II sporulation protein R [Clostridiaceae bacterium]